MTPSGVTSYYLHDGQGSVRGLTNSGGSTTDTYAYTAFGELYSQTGTTVNNYLYTGQQFDSLTGLYDLRARYYDPSYGRFISRDTDNFTINDPTDFNRYSYTASDPIDNFDPSGYQSLTEYSMFKEENLQNIGEIQQVGRITKAMYDIVDLVMRAKYYIAFLSNLAYLTAKNLTAGVGLVQDLETGQVSFVFAFNGDQPYFLNRALDMLGWTGEESTPLGDTIINNLPNYEDYAINGNLHAESLIKGWADANGYEVLGIGISRVTGVCQLCWAIFEGGDVPVFWSNWWADKYNLP